MAIGEVSAQQISKRTQTMPQEERYFLGTTSDRKKAFYGIEAIELDIEQDVFKNHIYENWRRHLHYTLDNVPRTLPCVNPRCQRGGFDLQSLILFRGEGEHEMEMFCRGDEGTPKGRRKGDPCDNFIKFKLHIKKTKQP